MTVNHFRDSGHDVKDVRGSAGQGMADPDLWQVALAEGRLLITTDRGFVQYRAVPHNGIIIVRLRQPNRYRIHSAAMLAFDRFKDSSWENRTAVVRDRTLSVTQR